MGENYTYDYTITYNNGLLQTVKGVCRLDKCGSWFCFATDEIESQSRGHYKLIVNKDQVLKIEIE